MSLRNFRCCCCYRAGFTLGFTILFQRVFDEEFQMQQDRIKRQRANAPVAFHAISASTAAAAAVAAAAAPPRGQMSLSSFLTKK
jgi:hypothetical protein